MAAELDSSCGMVDVELDRQFGAGDAHLSAAALQHLEKCDRCRRLHASLFLDCSPDPYSLQPSMESRARVDAAIRDSLRPVAPLPSTYVRAGQFLLLFLVVGLIKIAVLGPAGFHLMSGLEVLGNILITLLGGSLLSFSLSAQMTPGSARRFSSGTMAALLAVAFFAGAALLTPWSATDVFLAQGWPCFRAGALMALPVGFVYWRLVRRGRPLSAVSLGGTLGAIGGLLGAAVLQFTCSRQEVGHLLVWHGGVIAVSAALGILIALACRRMDFERP